MAYRPFAPPQPQHPSFQPAPPPPQPPQQPSVTPLAFPPSGPPPPHAGGFGRFPPAPPPQGFYNPAPAPPFNSTQPQFAYGAPPPPMPPIQPHPSMQYFPPSQPLVPPMMPPPPPPPSSPPPVAPPPPPPAGPAQPRPPTQRESAPLPRQQSLSKTTEKDAKPAGLPRPGPRVETEAERQARKRREHEKMRQQQSLRHSQATVLQKTNQVIAGSRGGVSQHTNQQRHHGSAKPGMGAERTENRLKKPTTFLCKMKFRNELPLPSAQPKVIPVLTDKDRFSKYRIMSSEKSFKWPLITDSCDLGLPLDLLDLNALKPPAVLPPIDPEDEELLQDRPEVVTTPFKSEGIRRKERPTDQNFSWLVKTQYVSSLSSDATKQRGKEIPDRREAHNVQLNKHNKRERQIHGIEESFRASKMRLVHQTKRGLNAEWVLPLLPDFDRYNDSLVMVNFDGNPTSDLRKYDKLERPARDEFESHAVMKSYAVNNADRGKADKFLAYMLPSYDELNKDNEDNDEGTQYFWLREYLWDVRVDKAVDPATYLMTFGEDTARYMPLPARLVLQKKRAKEGRAGENVEHFPVPSRITVRRSDGSSPKRAETSDKHAGKRERHYSDDRQQRPRKLSRRASSQFTADNSASG